jgi:hypothetical protein
MRPKRSTRGLILEMRYKNEASLPLDTTILALEQGASFEFEDLQVYERAGAKTDPYYVPHPLEGYWSVKCFDSDGFFPTLGMFDFNLAVASDGSITGSGESYVGQLNITGASVSPANGLNTSVDLKMVIKHPDEYHVYVFHGTHSPERDTITGSWDRVERPLESAPEASAVDDKQQPASNDIMHDDSESGLENDQPQEMTNVAAEESNGKKSAEGNDPGILQPAEDPQTPHKLADNAVGIQEVDDCDVKEDVSPEAVNTFSMRRTPADIHRFRRNLNLDSEADPSVMAKNRWKFAIEATKFQVQVKNMSWEHVRARFAERRLWLDFAAAFWQNLLRPDRVDMMCALTEEYAPSQSRLYETIAKFLNDREYAFKT